MGLLSMFSTFVLMGLIHSATAMHKSPDCTYPLWESGTEYCVGDRVQHNSAQYESLWCTQEEPGTGGEYDGWSSLGPCNPSSTPTPPTPTPTTTSSPTTSPSVTPTPSPGSAKVVAYFASWKVYYNYFFKNVDTSGSATMLTHIVYAFGGVKADGTCYLVDPEADTDKYFTSENSVDGSKDQWDQPLRGNFNQILQLKKKYPHLKVLFSFGGWTLSDNFGAVSQNPGPFAKSCYDLVFNERWSGVFDGIDIDWEYPNACGQICDTSGPEAYAKLLSAVRTQFGDKLVTSAITGDGTTGGKIDAANYTKGSESLDFMMVMTYDYFGAWNPTGPTAPHSPLKSYSGMPTPDMDAHHAIQKLKGAGVPSEKLLLGIGFYGRGWTGVTQEAPGGTATGAAPGIEPGVENTNVLMGKCPHTGFIAGTSYAFCDQEWWSYDIPETIRLKGQYAADQQLGGLFAWELSGDTDDAILLSAMTQTARSRIRTCSVTGSTQRCSA